MDTGSNESRSGPHPRQLRMVSHNTSGFDSRRMRFPTNDGRRSRVIRRPNTSHNVTSGLRGVRREGCGAGGLPAPAYVYLASAEPTLSGRTNGHNRDHVRAVSVRARTYAQSTAEARDTLSHPGHAVRIGVLQFALGNPDPIVLHAESNLGTVCTISTDTQLAFACLATFVSDSWIMWKAPVPNRGPARATLGKSPCSWSPVLFAQSSMWRRAARVNPKLSSSSGRRLPTMRRWLSIRLRIKSVTLLMLGQ